MISELSRLITDSLVCLFVWFQQYQQTPVGGGVHSIGGFKQSDLLVSAGQSGLEGLGLVIFPVGAVLDDCFISYKTGKQQKCAAADAQLFLSGWFLHSKW